MFTVADPDEVERVAREVVREAYERMEIQNVELEEED